jgi:hypothetical protein
VANTQLRQGFRMALRARSPEGDAHVVPCCDCARVGKATRSTCS